MQVDHSRKQSLIRAAALLVLAGLASKAQAQVDAPSDFLQITADTVETWNDGTTQVVVVNGPVTVTTDRATMSGKQAVIWFSRVEGSVLNRQRAEVALIGEAKIEQGAISRSGDRLFASTIIGGTIRLTVETRKVSDPVQSPLYKQASDMRPLMLTGGQQADNVLIQRPWIEASPTDGATTRPTQRTVTPKTPVTFAASDIQTTTATADGNIAVILKGGVFLLQRRANGDLIELRSQQAVLFTTVKDFNELQGGSVSSIQDAITSAYLEGDVRIAYTQAATGRANLPPGEQRLDAERVYYEFGTDRAVLTDVVLQATDPRVPFPVTMRANTVRQLAIGEYKADGMTLTTSQFATPSYSVNATKAYVRQYKPADEFGTRTQFTADNATFRTFGIPVFYLPRTSGEITERGFPLRGIAFGGSRGFGPSIQTEWGLFESIGKLPPDGLDASYHLDYYGDRGPGIGFDASYKGGFITDASKQGWNFNGDLTSYLVLDSGQDRLGRDRTRLPIDSDGEYDNELRGRIQWEHQHFLPDNWQVQLRAGYTSDETFLEEWYEPQFNDGLPTNLSAYAKRQRDTEALTFLLEYQPSDVVTNAGSLQERFPGDGGSFTDKPFEIDRLPEIGYYRVGDSFGDDAFTFFSENRVGGYSMHESDATLAEYGFRNNGDRAASPGIASAGYTGASDDYVLRGDFRQQIDYPIDAGEYKIVPYAVLRSTSYSDSPADGAESRLLAGIGTRITTAFWNIDDTAESKFWDIHRVRHIVEPELNVFASVSTTDRDDLYIYDETIDGVNDVAAASFFVRQRWQTKRGGPGKWRNTDFLALNLGVIGFANTPDDPSNPDRAADLAQSKLGPIDAKGFRGLFYNSMPEASIPRSTVAGDALWRLSDNTLVLSDFAWNIEEQSLATVSAGLLVGRGDRATYYTGVRYIGELDSTIASFTSNYQLTAKYAINFGAAIDLAETESRGGTLTVVRRFDRFFLSVGTFYDATEEEGGLQFSIYPEGLAAGIGSNTLSDRR